MSDDGAAAVSCCSAFYEQDWVRQLADDSFHPGGPELTRRTVAAMDLPPGASLLDLGCGTGTTAIQLAQEFGLAVTGVDMSADNLMRARQRTEEALANTGQPLPRYLLGSAQNPPVAAGEIDGVLAECVFSLVPDQRAALTRCRELLRSEVTGRAGFTDMAIGPGLDPELAEAMAPWTCLQGARDEAGWRQVCTDAGFEVDALVDESEGLTQVVRKLKRRLLVLGAGQAFAADSIPLPFELETAKRWLDRFQEAVSDGAVRYLRVQLRPT